MAILTPSVEHLQFSAAREGLDAVPKPTSGKPLGLALKAEDVDQFRREKSSPWADWDGSGLRTSNAWGLCPRVSYWIYMYFRCLYLYAYIWGPDIDLPPWIWSQARPHQPVTGDIHSIKASNAAGTRHRVEAFGKERRLEHIGTPKACVFLSRKVGFVIFCGTKWSRKSIAGDC